MRRETIDGLDRNGLLKTYTLSMEDKMEVLGALGIMGETPPFNFLLLLTPIFMFLETCRDRKWIL